MSEAYCLGCKCKMPYTVEKYLASVTINGVSISYEHEVATCTACGEEMYVPAINDKNYDARAKAYYAVKRW